DDYAEQTAEQPRGPSDEPAALGTIVLKAEAGDHDLTVTNCTLTAIPGPEIAIAWFRLEAQGSGTSSIGSSDAAYILEFQIQETTSVSGVALLGFENSAENLLYTGTSGQALPGEYQLAVNDANFDVRSGNNGSLEPMGSGYAEPVWVDAATAFTVMALRETNDDAAPFVEASLSVSLTSRCQLSWRLED
ncbi:MAG: hypothetical protein AB8B93_20055, partial [Pseudomonadales bacterium]